MTIDNIVSDEQQNTQNYSAQEEQIRNGVYSVLSTRKHMGLQQALTTVDMALPEADLSAVTVVVLGMIDRNEIYHDPQGIVSLYPIQDAVVEQSQERRYIDMRLQKMMGDNHKQPAIHEMDVLRPEKAEEELYNAAQPEMRPKLL